MSIKKLLSQIVPMSDDKVIGFRDQGDRARDEQEWKTAVFAYRQYLEARPHDAGIWIQLGHALKESRQYVEAENAYLEALAINGRDADLLLNGAKLIAHMLAELEIKGGKRLVEQQHLGLNGKRAGDGHPLLLAAGKLAHQFLALVWKGDELEELAGFLGAPGL